MNDYYSDSQVNRIEQAAYDGAMLEAGKEWERQRGEFGATEAELQSRIANLEDRIAALKAENKMLQVNLSFRQAINLCNETLIKIKEKKIIELNGWLDELVGFTPDMDWRELVERILKEREKNG